MENKIKIKKIRPVLLNMDEYDTETWPMSRADVVRATIYRLQPQLNRKWRTKQQGDQLSVTRIA